MNKIPVIFEQTSYDWCNRDADRSNKKEVNSTMSIMVASIFLDFPYDRRPKRTIVPGCIFRRQQITYYKT